MFHTAHYRDNSLVSIIFIGFMSVDGDWVETAMTGQTSLFPCLELFCQYFEIENVDNIDVLSISITMHFCILD